MLMPVGLKGKDRERYVKDNAWRFAKRAKRVVVNKHLGLRSSKSASATRQAEPQATDKRAGEAKTAERKGKG